MNEQSQEDTPDLPIQHWLRALGVVLFSILTLVLEVKDYGGYVVGAFAITEGFVKVHGYFFGLPIGNKATPHNLPDTPENTGGRLWVLFFGLISVVAGVVGILLWTLK